MSIFHQIDVLIGGVATLTALILVTSDFKSDLTASIFLQYETTLQCMYGGVYYVM